MKIQKKNIYKNKKVKLLCDSIKEISFEERTSNGNQLQLELLSIQMSTNYSQIVCVVFFLLLELSGLLIIIFMSSIFLSTSSSFFAITKTLMLLLRTVFLISFFLLPGRKFLL